MGVFDILEKKITSIVHLNAVAAIAPVLVAAGAFYGYHEVMTAVRSQNEKQSLVLIAMEKQGLPGKLLKVVDEKLGPSIPSETKVEVCNTLLMMCNAKDIPLSIACGLIEVESNWNVKALSNVGAKGLMQIMPATAKPYLRVERKTTNSDELYNPVTAIIVGLSYFSDLQAQYVELGITGENVNLLALHSYYWGNANTAKLLGKKDEKVSTPNMSYPLRVLDESKKYKLLGF